MDIITNLESKIKDLKERIAENEVSIKKRNRVQVAYVVYGEKGHRQRASWDESTKIFKENITIEFLNSDVTGHHDYSIVIITASNREECESELYAQLSDGAFENCNYGEIVEIDIVTVLSKMLNSWQQYG